jgi:hypothetical protein
MARTRIHRRLDRVEGALAASRPVREAEDDSRELATEVIAAFGQMVGHYREHYKLSPQEAGERAADTLDRCGELNERAQIGS